MASYTDLIDVFARWIDRVAAGVLGGLDHLRPSRLVRLAEQADGTFVVTETADRGAEGEFTTPYRIVGKATDDRVSGHLATLVSGARVDLLLCPHRFVFRPLELPSAAGDFLDGIVRAQIDRLTPWSAADAIFGCSAPAEIGSGRMVVTVAATGRRMIMPLVEALSGLGAVSIRLSVASAGPNLQPIEIFELKTRAERELGQTRRILVGILAGLTALAVASIAAMVVIGSDLDAKEAETVRRIAEVRARLQLGHDPSSEPALALQKRKQETLSSVEVIEALARSLPDHTYVTELRIQDGKVQIIGMTRDAPSLIRLLEQTPQFSEASFFAPTTRSLAKPGENFHIEAKIRPHHLPSL